MNIYLAKKCLHIQSLSVYVLYISSVYHVCPYHTCAVVGLLFASYHRFIQRNQQILGNQNRHKACSCLILKSWNQLKLANPQRGGQDFKISPCNVVIFGFKSPSAWPVGLPTKLRGVGHCSTCQKSKV